MQVKEKDNSRRIVILLCGVVCCLIMGFAYTYSLIQPYVMK